MSDGQKSPPSSGSMIVMIFRIILRTRRLRRNLMFGLTLAMMIFVFLGAYPMAAFLSDRPWLFIFYWLFCGFLVITSIFLAIYDMLCAFTGESGAIRQAEFFVYHPADRGALEGALVGLGAHAHHQLVPHQAAGHAPVHQEHEPAEHAHLEVGDEQVALGRVGDPRVGVVVDVDQVDGDRNVVRVSHAPLVAVGEA